MTLILSGTDGLSDVDGSAATPAIRGTDTNTGIFFPAADTIAFSEGGVESMRLDSSGNLGIGTSSPVGKVDSVANATAAYVARASTTGANQTANALVTFNSDASLYALARYRAVQHIWDYAGTTEGMRLDSSGNLLVGTTSATPNPGFAIYPAGGFSAGNSAGATGFEFATFRRSGVQIGSITQNGTTAVAYNTSSDYRLKENIAPMTGALAKVAQLNPVTYNWKSDGSAGQGFIAHELQVVVPDAVTGEKDGVETYTDEDGVEQTRPKYQGIDTSFLVATLTAAIQEQQALIQSLTARIAALEAKE